MDFDLSQDQRDLQSAARAWFTAEWAPDELRAVLDGSPLPDLRPALAKVGYLDVLAAGGTVLDLAVIATEAGRVLAPAPLIGTAARAVPLLQASGAHDLLAEVATGLTSVAVLDGDFHLAADGTVSGRCDLAPNLTAADLFLLLAESSQGPRILAVRRGPETTPIDRAILDASRDLGGIILTNAPATVLDPPEPRAAWAHTALLGTVIAAAEDLGTLERSLEMMVAYAKERHTFGRAIGSYQAVKHACVDVYVDLELVRSLVWLAAWTAASAPDRLPLPASAAASLSSEALTRATDSLIHIHGGLGFTWSHNAHLYWRRAQTSHPLHPTPNTPHPT
ncbi:acyl-CoA dehydrogenase family protein [Actinocorallia sp. A-T 12471]|uniref:acyl-CoA dehydrogenase family protein n=1 Tax=Actinocorallia sp. A-T 12471 TaxID=3089813 RepID=UPI0029CD84C2|nr:acyl-CoA dehydrogenase family protein [Actinocorallia sp. A-T 12471]MDX6743539.1 acyl-CoA dehydrogenase family protein [Actinocorallia sp. A-T 12471]